MKLYTIQKLPKDYLLELALKTKAIRKQQGFSQQELAKRSGVTYASLKRFEQTGQIAMESFLMLLFALKRISDFDDVLLLKDDLKAIEKLFDV